jgi:hypothetical protein
LIVSIEARPRKLKVAVMIILVAVVFRKISIEGFPGSGNTGRQTRVLKPSAL